MIYVFGIFLDNFNGFSISLLHVFFGLSLIFGIFVIITRNPVISVLNLIALFITISAYLFLVGLNFIALSYILVYIGAVKIRIIRLLGSNIAALVRIQLYKGLFIIIKFLFSITASLRSGKKRESHVNGTSLSNAKKNRFI